MQDVVEAGFLLRLLARILDEMLVLPWVFWAAWAGYDVGSSQHDFVLIPRELIAGVYAIVAYVGVGVAYHMLLSFLDKQSFGRYMAGTALVGQSGERLPKDAVLLHWALSYASILPLGLGCLRIIWDSRRLTWHDSWTDTRVVVSRRVQE